ncbi:MAG TPA: glycoside hydrolase family 3 N-terminal domain-containing protein [Blastocatellia bacterium]|nr:glycoside hydrolase family 3 N-terminal domain-containing protein [Blastocatellia bacterium]
MSNRIAGAPLRLLLAVFLSLALLVPSFAFAQSSQYPRFDRGLTKKEEKWVQDTLRKLTLDEKIGQMFMADANAIFMNRESEAYKQLAHRVTDNKVGGVILFRSDVWATAMLINRMQGLAKLPLLVSADLEMGMGMRLDDTPWWPPNMAVAATGDPKYARLQGEVTAREARSIGINWLYAPVADVNNNPDNPVINVRSYGEDPAAVGEFVSAFIEGAQSAGAMACAKHFPGHGDTATDSHIGLPVVDADKSRLDKLELVPFRAAIARHVGSIMSAHISLPRIETEAAAPLRVLNAAERENAEFVSQTEANAPRVTKPATLSSKVLTGILRDELGFKGLIVSDAMSMAGVSARYDSATAAVEAVKAGMDVIEKSPDIDAAIRGIREAVRRGEITEARINASVERILRAKAALGLNERRLVDTGEVDREVSGPQSNAVAQEIAERSITLVRDERKLLPLKLGKSSRLLNITFADDDPTFTIQPFVSELRRRELQVDSVTLDQRAGEADVKRLLERLDARAFSDRAADRFDAVIFSVTVRARSGKGSVALPPVGSRLADELARRDLPLIVVSLGNPYLLTAMPNAKTYLTAYSPFPVSQRAMVRALLGEIDVTGRLPVSLPGLYERGHGIEIRRARILGTDR